jgi:acyl-CoA oxidase
METTATYDEKAKEFVIDCPTVLSQKYWITNGAVHANFALVFAQTFVKGKHEGVNAFLVPIRDKSLKAFKGVEINDMGIKMGLNGIDNGALKFHNVRVPRVNMMNRYADVDENGVFKSDIKGIQQRFFKVTERLLSGRLCIASMTLGGLKSMIYFTIKYSQQRKGVSPNGLSQTPIFDYQLQKNALVPLIAKTLALNMLHNYAKASFANQKDHSDDLLAICCVDKALMGWHAERACSTFRERTGGQGFLAANFFAEYMASTHAAITAEGDNKVLMIKVAKDLLGIAMKKPDYFYTGDNIKLTEDKQLHCLKTLNTVFLMLERLRLNKLIAKMSQLKSAGKTNYEILMFETSDEIQEFSFSHGERLALANCIASLEKLSGSRAIVKNYFLLFAWEVLLRELSLLVLEGWICPVLAKRMKDLFNEQVKVAARDIDVVVESLNIPVHALKVPIAKDYVKYNSYANLGEVVNAKL